MTKSPPTGVQIVPTSREADALVLAAIAAAGRPVPLSDALRGLPGLAHVDAVHRLWQAGKVTRDLAGRYAVIEGPEPVAEARTPVPTGAGRGAFIRHRKLS